MRKIQLISTAALLTISVCLVLYIVLDRDKNTVTPEEKLAVSIPNGTTESSKSESIVLKELHHSTDTAVNFAEKPTVLLFFTSWCPYCNEDAPKIVKLQSKYQDQVNVVGINLIYRDDMDEAKKYAKKHDINYPVLLDEDGELFERYGGSGFPALYFVNSKGEAIDQIIGSTDIDTIESSFIHLIENYS